MGRRRLNKKALADRISHYVKNPNTVSRGKQRWRDGRWYYKITDYASPKNQYKMDMKRAQPRYYRLMFRIPHNLRQESLIDKVLKPYLEERRGLGNRLTGGVSSLRRLPRLFGRFGRSLDKTSIRTAFDPNPGNTFHGISVAAGMSRRRFTQDAGNRLQQTKSLFKKPRRRKLF